MKGKGGVRKMSSDSNQIAVTVRQILRVRPTVYF